MDHPLFRSADNEDQFYRQHREILETVLTIKPDELSSISDVEKLLATGHLIHADKPHVLESILLSQLNY